MGRGKERQRKNLHAESTDYGYKWVIMVIHSFAALLDEVELLQAFVLSRHIETKL